MVRPPPRFYTARRRTIPAYGRRRQVPLAAVGWSPSQWHNITPFGIRQRRQSLVHRSDPPPALTSTTICEGLQRGQAVGGLEQHGTAPGSGRRGAVLRRVLASFVFNLAARQLAVAQGNSLSENARALALLNMATSDSLVASFGAKYLYNSGGRRRRSGPGHGRQRETDPDPAFAPFIPTPCFPSYPSNHAAGATVGPR